MIFYTAEGISKIINGKIIHNPSPDTEIKNIATDSRTVANGKETIFFALNGIRNDGHDYLPALAKKGVTAAVISRVPEDPDIFKSMALIMVEDTLRALQQLASFHRSRFEYPVIGITGSNGKTVTKEWLYDLLNGQYSIIRSPKSYNSQVGVPLSVWLMNQPYSLAIFEAGISFPGEMEKLEKIIKPDIGIYTNTGSAHQENFRDKRHKTEEKLKLFRNAKRLVFSADQSETSDMLNSYCQKYGIQKFSWSLTGNPAVINFSKSATNSAMVITTIIRKQEYSFFVPFTAASAIENVCHCFTALIALGTPVSAVIDKFSSLEAIAMRLEIKQGKHNCILINDYYNSDINALTIALSTLENQALKGHLKKILILSDIKQSGIEPHVLYSMVNDMVVKASVDRIVGIGPDLVSEQSVFDIAKEFYTGTNEFLQHFNFQKLNNSAILMKGAREFSFERISAVLQEKAHQTVLEIDMNAMVENLNHFRSLLGPATKIMAMVKAFSYGSGAVEIAKLLEFQRVDFLAVAVADEGVELRESGITTPIIVMNPEPFSFQNMFEYKLEPNIYSFSLLKEFSKAVQYNALLNFPVHIKIDTGMNRLGFKREEEIAQVIHYIKETGNLIIRSVFSHLAASDDPSFDSFTKSQIDRFEILSSMFLNEFDYRILRHILNSAGVERFSEYRFDMARLGIGLYGISSVGGKLKNISILKTSVSQIKDVSPEETIGYNRSGKVTKPSKVAVIPIGYADGLSRRLGNHIGRAYINGLYVPVIGNICMDMCMLDVTGVDVKEGDEVELFGPHIPVTELAQKTGTISYEILTGISQRVKRIYLQE